MAAIEYKVKIVNAESIYKLKNYLQRHLVPFHRTTSNHLEVYQVLQKEMALMFSDRLLLKLLKINSPLRFMAKNEIEKILAHLTTISHQSKTYYM